VNIRFACPVCDHPGRLDLPGPREWQCPGCDHRLQVRVEDVEAKLQRCALCGNGELYRKKNFPHWLGLTLLALACVAFLVTNFLYQQWWAWAILLGSAAFDGLLYLAVGDVVVCYRCGARHRGFPGMIEHAPFELSIGERYRQDRLRREIYKAEKNP
jgi:hypothetical protein